MARCEEGYRCQVCGQDVESITESDLYLRFVIGELDAEVLHSTPERHIRCNPALAQFIDHPLFEPVVVDSPFSLRDLDLQFVKQRQSVVTAGYVRLLEVESRGGDRDITKYPIQPRSTN